jgi:hypothetical protein
MAEPKTSQRTRNDRMSDRISKQDKNVKEKLSGWDKAIADLERHLARIKAALGHAREMKAAGEPWPGQSATRN